MKALIKKIAELEAGKTQLNGGQIKEIIKCIAWVRVCAYANQDAMDVYDELCGYIQKMDDHINKLGVDKAHRKYFPHLYKKAAKKKARKK